MADSIDRREFLKKSGKAVAAAAVFGAGYVAFAQRPDFPVVQEAEIASADYSLADISLKNKLAVAEGGSPAELGRRAVNALGGMEKFVQKGDKVLIKPNAAWDRTPEQAACTNPELMAELTRMTLAAGASEVVVTDVTCHDPRRTFARSGIQEAVEKAGGRVIIAYHYRISDAEYEEVDMGGQILSVWPVLKYFMEVDKVINVPIVKNHTLSRATIGMKNLYGIIGGKRHQLHQQIDRSIVDLSLFLKPTLVVGDAYRVLMRNGPTGGSTGDVKTAETVFATVDQVAADSFGCKFLDLNPSQVRYIPMGQADGLGQMDISKMDLVTA
ncbi:MAG: DUF362 domain-containing protein [candidate division Zixibacteria bacterium]|jgi:uncharacterized protein (DUF362 family)|nr:DUF362 domain-containing protein [candidate division Zixibacteria bacterium]